MSTGATSRVEVKVDLHREARPGYTWCMDTVTMPHRSEKGNKFLPVLRCGASNKLKLFCHYLKSGIRDMIEAWIQETRADAAFHDTPYKMVSRIKLDNAGEWSLECNEWHTPGFGVQFGCF